VNRQQRRAALKRDRGAGGGRAADIDRLFAQAHHLFEQDRLIEAQELCRSVIARAPAHVGVLNLMGRIAQRSGRHAAAVRFFGKALSTDPNKAACHFSVGCSHQALGERAQAVAHFTEAIALGLDGQNVNDFVLRSPPVAACLDRMATAWPRRLRGAELFGADGITALANDLFVCCAQQTFRFSRVALEDLFAQARAFLLQTALSTAPDFADACPGLTDICAALATQCFINEYIYPAGEGESRQAAQLREALQQALAATGSIPTVLVAIVAAYYPLHSLANADVLLSRRWPSAITALLRQQIEEPLVEARDRASIPVLTTGTGNTEVRQQYEENPYPRWTLLPRERPAEDGAAPSSILVAGCGTGYHSIAIAQLYPDAQVLAVDISLASIGLARRKTSEAGLRNLAHAQADIMGLGDFDRRFDRVEAIGVLHHLDDPLAGWRLLLGLLHPGGTMAVGLYSRPARAGINAARAFVADAGYRPTADGIRACRQALIQHERSTLRDHVTTLTDFYSMSECRDLLFNAMEHQFTIADIRSFLAAEELQFLGFDLESTVLEAFRQQNPGAETDLACWERFEAAHPQTFLDMYVFSVRRST
jgi:SAM-dependent methyltransferase